MDWPKMVLKGFWQKVIFFGKKITFTPTVWPKHEIILKVFYFEMFAFSNGAPTY